MRLFLNKIYSRHPRYRRLLLVIFDLVILQLSLFISFWITSENNDIWSKVINLSWIFYFSFISAIPIYFFTGQYRSLTKYFDIHLIYYIGYRNLIVTFLIYLFGLLNSLILPNFSTFILVWILITSISIFYRLILRDFLYSLSKKKAKKIIKVSIYGTGSFAAQLAVSLRQNGNYKVLNFIDDDQSLWNRNLLGLQIKPLNHLETMPAKPDQILLAVPDLSRSLKKKIIDQLQSLHISVLQIPSIEELRDGRAKVDQLREILIDDLLGRDIIMPDPNLLGPGIRDNVVCVTGAGGSIGSELCRQIILLNPKVLILIERNEPSLYFITEELKKTIYENKIIIKSFLGSVANYNLIEKIFRDNSVDIVFHAAAYKHVPLVENNPIAGIYNNSIATLNMCFACEKTNIKKFVLVSTDKSVRPTNVMGASKRLAELIVQAFANKESKNTTKTCYSMVRFGNVLASSGSVVPLFRKQIKQGGPVTITHPEIRRYFMTITEASQLVIQASFLSKGGDLFLLDMGEPVLIKDLAEKMIILSGLKIKSDKNKSGDIEIVYTGLRPGEKLFEELLIDTESVPTKNPLIFTAKENFLNYSKLIPELEVLKQHLKQNDQSGSLKILSKLVPEWKINKNLFEVSK